MISSKLISDVRTFVFEFSFSPDDPLLSPPASPPSSGERVPASRTSPYTECLFYREDEPQEYFYWSGNLSASPVFFELPPNPTGAFEVSYADNNNCKGSFKLYKNSYTGEMFVWFDVNFGVDYLNTFEGDMVKIAPSKVPDPPIKTVPPKQPGT